ncbi:MAG: stage II sporulation protein P [Mycobacterium leprae]
MQIFRPSQPAARLMLRLGLPFLAVGDQESQENRSFITYWTGRAGEQPQTLFQVVLPFLRPTVSGASPGAQPLPTPSAGESPGSADVAPPEAVVPQAPPVNPAVNDGKPLIGIYHTHDWESYISEFPGMVINSQKDRDNIKSDDHKKRTVVDLGSRLAAKLRDLGVTTVHAPGTHQSLGYDYAYQASRVTAKRILKEAPSVRILLDIHRDSADNTTAEIKGQKVARVRCIIGNAEEPHWEANKGFCEQLTNRLNKAYPGITMPIMVKSYSYNQDLLPGAILLEVGGAMNQYQEAERAVDCLAETLAAMTREGAYP